MRGKNKFAICLISMLLITAIAGIGTSPLTTKVYVDPPEIVDRTGAISEFPVYVNVTDVTELYAWSFRMLFNPIVLQVAKAELGTWLHDASGWPVVKMPKRINNDLGYVFLGQLLDMTKVPTNGASGSGNLATITFEVVGPGVTTLELDPTKLDTVIAGQKVKIEHEAKDGLFDNRPEIKPPNAVFEVKGLRVEAQPLTFDASASNDKDDLGWIVSYYWDFGDGTNATDVVVTHAYASRGTYTASLTVTDNDGLTDSMSTTIDIVVWMEGGNAPDLIRWEAKPERPRLNEGPDARGMDLRSMLGNPTEDAYEVYTEFTLFSKDEAKVLGTLNTETVLLGPGEKLELRAYFDASDPTWRCFSGSPEWVIFGYYGGILHKYIGFASCYYWNETTDEFQRGNVAKYISFNVYPVYHDIGVLDVTASEVAPDGTVDISVTVTNRGDLDEPVDLNLDYLGRGGVTGPIDTTPVTIAPGENKTLTFTWDTTGLGLGPYLIIAKLPVLPYETEVGDNNLSTKIYITE